MNDQTNGSSGWRKTLPFPRRWLWYIAIKIAVLALAVYVTLNIYGLV
jgi:hypothetical protein